MRDSTLVAILGVLWPPEAPPPRLRRPTLGLRALLRGATAVVGYGPWISGTIALGFACETETLEVRLECLSEVLGVG